MQKGVKLAIAGTLVLVAVGAGEVAWIHHERNADVPVKAGSDYKSDPDDLVFLKRERPDSLQDEKALKGKDLWVSAGGQMDYYPYSGGTVDFAKSEGVLLGAEKIEVKDAVEQVAPKKTAIRIPTGDKQILLVFTKVNNPKEFATPVGYVEGGDTKILTDDIFFYDDPHQLYSYWGPRIWAAIDAHKAIPGMTEREAQMALGQVSTPHGDVPGDRPVDFYNDGHPVTVTFSGGKATRIEEQKS
jgi:hypothetical protein